LKYETNITIIFHLSHHQYCGTWNDW